MDYLKSSILVIFAFVQLVHPLDNGLALLPPMGWMSWSRFFCHVDCVQYPHACIEEKLYQQHADHLVSDGFKDVGYTHIHIDDCWSEYERDSNDRLVADKTRFPSGIPALADYMHKRGLKLGLYGDVGDYTCADYPGSHHYEEIDAKTLADWNVDYYKFDGCNSTIPDLRQTYQVFQKFLNQTGKSIIYSCEWPLYEHEHGESSNYTAISSTCNVFRNYRDVRNEWASILEIVDFYVQNQEAFIPYNGPGSWFDPDMLVIGNNLTVQESRTQFGVWAIWSAPLIMSNDLRSLPMELRQILQNKAVIAVDQDKLGIMGKMVKSSGNIYVFVKPMTPFFDKDNTANGRQYSYAVLCMNKGDASATVTIKFDDLGLKNQFGYSLVDLWTGKDLGKKKPADTYDLTVDAHDSTIFKATPLQSFGAPKRSNKTKN